MKDEEYAYAVAYIKTIENKMLTEADMENIASKDIGAALHFLKEHGWQGERIDQMLKNETERAYNTVSELLGEDASVEILLYRNDFHNLKTVLKAVFSGKTWTDIVLSPSLVSPLELSECIKSGSFASLPEFLSQKAKTAYDILSKNGDGEAMEVYVDRACIDTMIKRAKEVGDSFLQDYFMLFEKLSDFKTLWRCVRLGKSKEFTKQASNRTADSVDEVREQILTELPEADTDNILSFEKWCDLKLLSYAKSAGGESFSIRPIIAFLLKKQYEVRSVGEALSGEG